MSMDQIRALLACMEKKQRVASVRGGVVWEAWTRSGLYWRVQRSRMESCPCEEAGMGNKGYQANHAFGTQVLVVLGLCLP